MATDRIREVLEQAKKCGRIGLIPYVTVGFPTESSTTDVVRAIVKSGADIVELGVPFSDPLGDGPTIQASGHTALSNGVTPKRCIEAVNEIRSAGINVPIVLMGYYNNILTNLENFFQSRKQVRYSRNFFVSNQYVGIFY